MWVFRRISAAFASKSGALEAHLRPAGRWSEETEEGHPPSRTAGGPGGGLTGLCRRFPLPPVGGESAIFGAGGDQPPLAASRRGCLAAAEIADPGPARSSGAVWSPALPGSAGAVLTGDRVG